MSDKLRRVRQEFFRGATIRLVWNVDQRVVDGRLQIGGRAGPQRRLSNLCHEMAHFVEIDDDRCHEWGWGLRVPEVFIYDRMCANPVTNQATMRECRVAAYQLNLMRYLGARGAAPEILVRPFSFLPDWCYVPGGPGDGGRFLWCANLVDRLSAQPGYQIDAFKREWWRKNEILAERYRSAV